MEASGCPSEEGEIPSFLVICALGVSLSRNSLGLTCLYISNVGDIIP